MIKSYSKDADVGIKILKEVERDVENNKIIILGYLINLKGFFKNHIYESGLLQLHLDKYRELIIVTEKEWM